MKFMNKNYDKKDYKGPKKGEIGCILSHLLVWRSIYQNNNFEKNDLFAIFEDDAFFTDNFNEKWEKSLKKIKNNDIDILYIGGAFIKDFQSNNLDKWEKVDDNLYKTSNEPRTTHGYIITKKGAEKLIELANSEYGICEPLDVWMMNVMNQLNSYTIFPLLCWSPENYETDIQKKDTSQYFDLSNFNKKDIDIII